MLETAKSFRGTVAFAHVYSDLEDPSRIFEFFDLTATHLPDIRLIKIKGGLDNKIVPHYRSQKLPEDWKNSPVKTLVQGSAISLSHDQSKVALVQFYAP
ncbi:hypothetical protein GJ496_000656 [Pomphorhynchus laevis]|nr:hypothetical protein GJ496_000656 [Pomphorhynchus laevis]